MGQDTPDWGGLYNNSVVFPLFDMAELAARLGCPMVYDRRGAILWYDDFSHGLSSVSTTDAGLPAYVKLLSSGAFRGPFCVGAHCGNLAGMYAQVAKKLPLPSLSHFGASAIMAIADGTDRLMFEFNYHTNTISRYGSILFDFVAGTISAYTPAGYVAFETDLSLFPRDLTPMFVKVVIDPITDYFVRLLVNDHEYDLSAYEIRSQVAVGGVYAEFIIWFYNWGTGVGGESTIDNMIVTYAEP